MFRKQEIRLFFEFYPRLVELLFSEKRRFYVPVTIQSSPYNPRDDFIVILRDMRNSRKLEFKTHEIETAYNENRLHKVFALRSLSFASGDKEYRRQQLERDLLNFYENDGLMLIGGVQEAD